jgi:hypothetical protein
VVPTEDDGEQTALDAHRSGEFCMTVALKFGLKSALKTAFCQVQAAIGLNPYLRRPDRQVLENVIFRRFVADPAIESVLFDGAPFAPRS